MIIPSNIAIIMDGNGRWARERGMQRYQGHLQGVETLKQITYKAGELGISSLSVYAFSTENWERPDEEVNFLMDLFQETLRNEAAELNKNNVRVRIIGHRFNLSDGLLQQIEDIEKLTASNDGLKLQIAFNYGGRAEIVDVCRKLFDDLYKSGELKLLNLSEKKIAEYLYEPDCPDVELMIRTGGEQRISNFLLWQLAYAELYFIDKYWPDFKEEDLLEAIREFNRRDRRFGRIKE